MFILPSMLFLKLLSKAKSRLKYSKRNAIIIQVYAPKSKSIISDNIG